MNSSVFNLFLVITKNTANIAYNNNIKEVKKKQVNNLINLRIWRFKKY